MTFPEPPKGAYYEKLVSVVHALDEAHPRVALRYLDTIIKRRREAGTLTLMDLFTLSAWLETKREEFKRKAENGNEG